MRLRIYSAAISTASVLSVLAAALAIWVPASTAHAEAKFPEYTARLSATAGDKVWESSQRWGPTQSVFVQPYVGGKEVPGAGGNGSCGSFFAGKGIIARVNVCGLGAVPIRIHYRSLSKRPVRFTVRYGEV